MPWVMFTPNLMMIYSFVHFSFIRDYKRNEFDATLWRHGWRHHNENTLSWKYRMIFSYLMSYWSCVSYFWTFKMANISRLQHFFIRSDTGSWICHGCRHHHELYVSLHTMILDDLSISDVKFSPFFIFWGFQNGRHCEVAAFFKLNMLEG